MEIDSLRSADAAQRRTCGEKRASDDGVASDSSRAKRPRFDLSQSERRSRAEQLLLEGAAEIVGLSVDQLLCAVERYINAQSEPSSDEGSGCQETPTESSFSGDTSNTAQPGLDGANEHIRAPFQLTLPDLFQRGWRQPQLAEHSLSDSPVVTASNHETGPAEAVTPWLDDMIDDSLPWNWDFRLGPPAPTAHREPPLYPDELVLEGSRDTLFTGNNVMPSKPIPFKHPSPAVVPAVIPRSNPSPISNVSTPSLGSLAVPQRDSVASEAFNSCDTPSQKATDCATPSSVATRKSPGAQKGSQTRKRGPFKDQGQRQQTGLVRSLGACIRCSMQRIRCKLDDSNPNGCCLTCAEATKTRAHWVPCLRYKITDAELLDHELCPRTAWTVRWKKMEMTEISTWASDHIKTISCTQDVMGTKFELKVREFTPIPGDALARKWKRDGVDRAFECPPYAIASMKDASRVLARFVDRTLSSSIFFYIDETDKLLRDTYTMAYRQSKIAEREEERKLLSAVLRLWAASRLACRSDRICGTETLGMEPQDYGPGDVNSGILLTPPVFSAQLEVIITATLLVPAKREVLGLLRELLQRNERRSWFAIYLAMFILLHNCALLTQSDNKKARKQGLEARFFRAALVESLHHGAKILLAYFHYCNKGSHPFKMDWSEPDQVKCMEMDEEQIHFMQQTSKTINGKSEMFQRIREEGLYEHEYHFISQLYDVNWKPVHTI